MEPMRVGLVGCGHVSGEYLEGCARFPEVEVIACADANRAAAEAQAERHGIPRVHDLDGLLADPDVEIVINLTPPAVHVGVSLAAIAAGKHVFTEKPLAPSMEDARRIGEAARAAGVEVGCAPATFMSGPFQTARKLVDDGWIGRPVAGFASFTCRGYEHWHPNIDPFYSPGGGPMLDIGPYVVTTLLNVFGPAVRVDALTRRFADARPRPLGPPERGDIQVQVNTHVTGSIEFASGAVATVITSWEMWASNLPFFEVYGSEGSMCVPFADEFGATPLVRRGEGSDLGYIPTEPGGGAWIPAPVTHRTDTHRAVAVADMAYGLRNGQPFRASLAFATHALEIMLAFDEASATGRHVELQTTCARPAALPPVAAGEPVRFA